MKATLARRELAKMLAITRNPSGGRQADAPLVLSAAEGRMYVEADGIACGWEALVFVEGTCHLASRNVFAKVLHTFPGKNITIEADERGLRIGSFQMSLTAYSATASDLEGAGTITPSRNILPPPERGNAPVSATSSPLLEARARPTSVEVEEEFSELEILIHKAARDEKGRPVRVVMLAGPAEETEAWEATLAGTPCELETFSDGREAFGWMSRGNFIRGVLVLSELATPGVSVVPLIREVRTAFPEVAIVLCTISRALAVEAFDADAFGVVRGPAAASVFRGTVLRAWKIIPLPGCRPASAMEPKELAPDGSGHMSRPWARLAALLASWLAFWRHRWRTNADEQ